MARTINKVFQFFVIVMVVFVSETSLAAFYFSGIESEPPHNPTNVEECGVPSSIYSSSCVARPSPSGNDPSLNTAGPSSIKSSSSSSSVPLLSSGCSLPLPGLSKPVM